MGADPDYVIITTVRATNDYKPSTLSLSLDPEKIKDKKLSELIDLADLMGGTLSIHLVKNE